MTDYRLISRHESSEALAELLSTWGETTLSLSVREDVAFRKGGWLSIGTIALKPGAIEPNTDALTAARAAIHFGFYEWRCPSEGALISQLTDLLSGTDSQKKEQLSKATRSLDALAAAACRVGLIHPVFDADAVSTMPFRRPATVVTDTSAIIQGGLDFVVRFLYPMARVKVPAIAHMELLNASDAFLSLRRKNSPAAGRILLEHTMSQGGQRALLRLELQTDTEIERGRLGADPLRGVVHPGSDPEDKALGLSVIQRSFADRLIFETARQHLHESNPDHPVFILTCDQGLARMTIAEGMHPLFFDAVTVASLCDRITSGTPFNPLTGQLYSVALPALLWELSVAYGTVRLTTSLNDSLEISTMGEDLPWKPYHTKDDLLWVRSGRSSDSTSNTLQAVDTIPRAVAKRGQDDIEMARVKAPRAAGFYRFSPTKMLGLIEQLTARNSLSESKALDLIGSASKSQLADYGGFLLAGGFIADERGSLKKTDLLDDLWLALRTSNLSAIGQLLQKVSSFASFVKTLEPVADEGWKGIPERAVSTYTSLAEIAGLAMHIPDEKIYRTASNPLPSNFAETAWEAYTGLAHGTDEYVLTGAWLEVLGRVHGIHPVIARDRLEEARAGGLLDRYTEGSTPETRFSRHTLDVLAVIDGTPTVRRVGLYEGDFLLPGKGSVSLKLRRTAP